MAASGAPADTAARSQLLQRAACERAIGVAFADVQLAHTKGRKPYLVRAGEARHQPPRSRPPAQANAPAARPHAPNWNFNVSHEGAPPRFWLHDSPPTANRMATGNYVVLASEPFCVCGVDVAAPGQLRRAGATAPVPMQQYIELFKHQFTASETQRILAAGDEGAAPCFPLLRALLTPVSCPAAQQNCFRKLWSLKEAFVKARGDGLALELGRAEFALLGSGARVRLDGLEQPHWCVRRRDAGRLVAPLTAATGLSRCSSSGLMTRRLAHTGCVQRAACSALHRVVVTFRGTGHRGALPATRCSRLPGWLSGYADGALRTAVLSCKAPDASARYSLALRSTAKTMTAGSSSCSQRPLRSKCSRCAHLLLF